MYEPTFGEYAEKKDAVELYNLTKKTFDVLCDDVFTLEQWDKIIERKECLLHRENGNIVTFYPGFSEHMTRILKINRLKPLILLPFLLFYLKNISSCVIIKPITHDEVNCYGYNKTIR